MSFTRRPSDQTPYPPQQEPQRYSHPPPPMPMTTPTHPADQSSAVQEEWSPRRSSVDAYATPATGPLPPLQSQPPYEFKSYATRPDFHSDQPYQQPPTSPPNNTFRSNSSTTSSWDYSDARMQQIYRDRTFHQVIQNKEKKIHCPFGPTTPTLTNKLFVVYAKV